MAAPEILYLVINLPRAEARRTAIFRQAEALGITNLHVVPAVAGHDLPADLSSCGYDAAKRRKSFSKDLLPNEIACAMSHRKALQTFLESAADYAVILEDDAIFAPHFNEGIRELVEHLQGWQVAKLYTAEGKLYPITTLCADAPVQPVFPKKLPWVAVGYLYTRAAAQHLHRRMQQFWLPADAQIGKYLLDDAIPTIGIAPGLILSGDPNNEQSTLDTTGERRQSAPKRTLMQYLTYRAGVLRMAFGKKRMRSLMQKRLSRR